MKIKWGILSTARIARTQFIPAIDRAENAEVVAIASRNNKVHNIARELNIPRAYESYEALLNDPDIDAVYIPLPNHLHKEWAISAIQKGKHVLSEKPATLTAEEATEIKEALISSPVKYMEGFMYQFHPQHERVKEIIASGEIGTVKQFNSSFSFHLGDRENSIKMQKEYGGGSLYDVGCYPIHAARMILGSEPIELQAFSLNDQDSGVDLTTSTFMKFAGNVIAKTESSIDMANRDEYEIIGTKGIVKVPHAFRPDKVGGVGTVIVEKDNEIRKEKFSGDIYRLEVEHFSSAILNDGTVSYTIDDTINNMKVMDACWDSIKTGRSVNIK
ncbi:MULTISPECIES: Gfo/Idh/MocA family protein [Sutcliffiella]|uniref:Oxidoreductase n=1 Tax=Sutcliffiella cohnii TaxID=33932 RepID=A0A223KVC0_9BACI|nr:MULTISPECIES: Gfo/Idh/MocA family oxidoreductase [Sutcliffiella]AST93415.1 oxidoreductase [Sutcliffiella cohnii]WBL14582.1 Gfo/Idh/MocA family oxidoreductase [Sutcliffiella sp. NC1]